MKVGNLRTQLTKSRQMIDRLDHFLKQNAALQHLVAGCQAQSKRPASDNVLSFLNEQSDQFMRQFDDFPASQPDIDIMNDQLRRAEDMAMALLR
jgi:hypothetical protein